MWLPRHKRQASERQNRDRGKASRNDVGGSGNGRTAAAAAASFIYIYIYILQKEGETESARKYKSASAVPNCCRTAGFKGQTRISGGERKNINRSVSPLCLGAVPCRPD